MGLSHEGFVHIAPAPGFSRFERLDNRVGGLVKVHGGVLVLGRIAAPYVATFEAEAQVHPGITHFQTFLTALAAGFDVVDFIQVRAFG